MEHSVTVKRLRELLAIAAASGTTLEIEYSGRCHVTLNEVGEDAEQPTLGHVWIGQLLHFVGDADPDGEGWEFYSSKEAESLCRPRFITEDGESLTLAQVRALTEPAHDVVHEDAPA